GGKGSLKLTGTRRGSGNLRRWGEVLDRQGPAAQRLPPGPGAQRAADEVKLTHDDSGIEVGVGAGHLAHALEQEQDLPGPDVLAHLAGPLGSTQQLIEHAQD